MFSSDQTIVIVTTQINYVYIALKYIIILKSYVFGAFVSYTYCMLKDNAQTFFLVPELFFRKEIAVGEGVFRISQSVFFAICKFLFLPSPKRGDQVHIFFWHFN